MGGKNQFTCIPLEHQTLQTPRATSSWSFPSDVAEMLLSLPKVAADLIGTYVEDGELQLNRLRSAVACRAVCEIQSAAHSLKGASSQLGAETVARLCRSLEEHADSDQTSTQFYELEREFELVVSRMQAYKRALDSYGT